MVIIHKQGSRSKTFTFVRPARRTSSRSGTTFSSIPTGGGGIDTPTSERKQVFIQGVKVSDTHRILVQTSSGTKWVQASQVGNQTVLSVPPADATAEQRQTIQDSIRPTAPIPEKQKTTQLRQKEFLVRQIDPKTGKPTQKEFTARRGLTQAQVDRLKFTQYQPKTALQLFTEKAQEQFNLSETKQRLLEIKRKKRKLVIEAGKIRADIPITAIFTKGFEEQLGKFKLEEIKTVSPLNIFSEKAQKELRLSETKDDLLEITKEGRKIIIERKGKIISQRKTFIEMVDKPFSKKELSIITGHIKADIPISAEFFKGFDEYIGTGIDRTKSLGSRFKQFKAIGTQEIPIITKLSKKLAKPVSQAVIKTSMFIDIKIFDKLIPITTKIFHSEILTKESDRLEKELKGLRKAPGLKGKIGRGLIRGELFRLGQEIGARKLLGEKPISSALTFVVGGLTTKLIVSKKLIFGKGIKLTSKILGSIFVGTTATEIAIKGISEGSLEAGKIFGKRTTQLALFGLGARTVARRIKPIETKILKATSKTGEFAEVLDIKGRKAIGLQRLRLKTEIKTRKLQTDIKEFSRVIKTKDPITIAKLLGQKNVRFEFKLTEKGLKQVLVKDFPKSIRKFDIKPQSFEISIDGRIGLRSFGTTQVKEVKGITRIIDPTKFKLTTKDDFTLLERIKNIKTDLPGLILRAELGGTATITRNIKKLSANIFGIKLLPRQTISIPTTAIKGKSVILAIEPIIRPTRLIAPPIGLLTKRKKEPALKDPLLNLKTITITDTIQKQKPILDIKSIPETLTATGFKQKPILDIARIQKQEPILDIARIQETKPILDIVSITKQKTLVIPDLFVPPPPPPPTPIIEIDFPRGRPKKKKKKETDPFEDQLAFTPGFTSRTLDFTFNIEKESFKKQLRGKVFTGFEFRRIPILN